MEAGAVTYATGGTASRISWPAIVLSVVIGFGITVLLVTVGAAAGAMAGDDKTSAEDAGKIAAAIGTWTVIAAIGGTLIGSYIGGRFTRWTSRGFAIYHAMGAWALSVLLGAWLGAIGATGLLGAGLNQAANRPAKAQNAAQGADPGAIAEAVGWSGWALAAGMVLTLAVAILGWWLGSRRSLDDFETRAA